MAQSQEFSVFIRNFPSRAELCLVRSQKHRGSGLVEGTGDREPGKRTTETQTKTGTSQKPGKNGFESCRSEEKEGAATGHELGGYV